MSDTHQFNTPKWDLWFEIVSMIEGCATELSDQAAENNDLASMVYRGFGADPDETQEDRNNELENCIDFTDIYNLYDELGEYVASAKSIEKDR